MEKHSTNSASLVSGRKRKHNEEGGDASTDHVSGDSPAVIKRARLIPNKPKVVASVQPAEQSIDSGQKIVLLGLIRQRLSELDSRTLYVRKLPRNTTVEQLKTLCPTSINARIQSTKHANRRKHAFIEFKTKELAKAASKSADGKLLADRPIRAELCSERLSAASKSDEQGVPKPTHWRSPHQRQLSEFSLVTLHVTCIPRSATQDEIRELFSKAVNFEFNMNPKQKGIGSCRVTFTSHDDALESFMAVHGSLLRDCPLIVNFAFKKHKPRAKAQSSEKMSEQKKTSAKKPTQSGQMVLTPPSKSATNPTPKTHPLKKKQKLDKKQKPVEEPPIVPVYHAPLGSNDVKEIKSKKKKQKSSAITSPTPKKLKQSPKSAKKAT